MRFSKLIDKESILVEKRISELTCLGLEPVIYKLICKLLDRCVTFVVKDGYTYLFTNNTFKIIPQVNDEILNDLIIQTFHISPHKAEIYINEWKRDKTIYNQMSLDINKYWDYLALPFFPKEKEDIYNF